MSASLDIEAQDADAAAAHHSASPGAAREHLVLEWDDVSYAIKGKHILRNVSGRVESGELLAVMGPSGAG
ncbi:hypothetical protein EIP91_002054, partial [Steccherinum ochraceum]